jgi:hypothetical protein
VLAQRIGHQTVVGFQIQTVTFLLTHRLKRLDSTHQALKLALFARRWCPQWRLLSGHETGDECCIQGIGLVARQFALGKGVDPGRIDDAHAQALLVQEQRQGVAIDSGGFQTGVNRTGDQLAQPGSQLCETG